MEELAVAALQRALAEAQAIIELQGRIQEVGHDVDAVLGLVVEAAMRLTLADGAVVEILDEDDMVYRSVAGLAASSAGLRLAAVGSLSGLCVRERRALYAVDTSTDPRVDRDACQRVGARSMIVVPLLDAQHCHGVLKVYADRPAAFGGEATTLLEQLAAFIAVALRNAGDYAESQRQATHDALTGLPNRAFVVERLNAAMRNPASESSVSVAFIDLDGLKLINDTEGHAAGDALLIEVAVRLRSAVRDGDTVARIGGDEFVVVCPGTHSGEVDSVRERLSAALARLPRIAASVGVVASELGEQPTYLLARADEAMYVVKQSARRGLPEKTA